MSGIAHAPVLDVHGGVFNKSAYFFLIFCLALIVLHPYTLYGKPGIYIALLFVLYGMLDGHPRGFFFNVTIPALAMLTIATWGAFMSHLNGIPQLSHPIAAASLMIMLYVGRGVARYCDRHAITESLLLKALLGIVVFNSVLVLLEVQFPALRQAIESHLDPLTEGTINYAEGYRLRGIAASGGARLSVAGPVAIAVAFTLLRRHQISLFWFTISVAFVMAALPLIGRTGLVLLAVPFGTFIGIQILTANGFGAVVRLIGVMAVGVGTLLALYFFGTAYLTERFGAGFVQYAFKFLLAGAEGLAEEGTTGVVVGYLQTVPERFPQILTGYGFYGGSYFVPWTDSGYARSFLSVGFPLALLFYFLLFRTYLTAFKIDKYFVVTVVAILAIAEAKEPLLFNGVAARLFVVMLMYYFYVAGSSRATDS